MSIYNTDWQGTPQLKTSFEISSLSIPSFSTCPEFLRLSDILKTRKDLDIFTRFCYMFYIFIIYYIMVLTFCFISDISNLETLIICLVEVSLSFFSLHLYLVPVYTHIFHVENCLIENSQKRKITPGYIDDIISLKMWKDTYENGFMVHLISSFFYFVYFFVSFFIMTPSIVFFLISLVAMFFLFFYMIYLHIQITNIKKEEEKNKVLVDLLLKTPSDKDLKITIKCFQSTHLLQVILGIMVMGFS